MIDEPLGPRPGRGDTIVALGREDLDIYAVSELEERVEALQAEIARCRAQIDKKQAGKSAADALFNFKNG
ncbi:MAG TPA: DUF1192 domain-containing protein [Caulobacter sp.]|nr:DUF1192 domain-containing protein [Caulobacter sp.]